MAILKSFYVLSLNLITNLGVIWYSKNQCSLVFQGDTKIIDVVRSELSRIASKKSDLKNKFVQVADERPSLNCLANDDKTILQEQCIDLTNNSLVALTDHNEVETELQNNNDDLDFLVCLDLPM